MGIFIKLLIGFIVFFGGVIFNVSIMNKFEGRKIVGIMPMLSFIVIIAGLVILVYMSTTIPVDVTKGKKGSAAMHPIGLGAWR